MRQEKVVVVTAVGMVSSLGHDVDTACAASRAGIQRTEELDYPLRLPEDGSTQPAFGNRVPVIAEGFEGQARLRRLLEAALNDVKNRIPDDRWPTATPIYMALPNSARARSGVSLITDDDDREFQEDEAEFPECSSPSWSVMIEQAIRAAHWPVSAPVRQVFASGHTGVAEALQQALADIAADRSQAALVGGVDSLIGERTLSWLEGTARLRTPAIPTGLLPGEAAALLVLEHQPSGVTCRTNSRIVVRSVATSEEATPLLSGEQSFGGALYDAIDRLVSHFCGPNERSIWFITDMNGEMYAAAEWGNALVRMTRHPSVYPDPLYWYPAVSFGDVGAAMGAVCVCTAIKAWERGYAPAAHVIIVSSSEGTRRAAALLEFESPVQM